METNYKITIAEPCHENWNQMTPDQTGRFCNSCVKSVVDFTNMKAQQIQEYFIKNQGQSVCGRFKNEQINTFDIQIPQSVLNRKLPFHKAFILALFIAMGSSLFSCKNHDDAMLGEVTVVQDTVKHEPKDTITEKEILGKVDMERYDSLVKAGVKMPKLPSPPPPMKQAKFAKSAKTLSYKKEKPYLITTGIVSIEPKNQTPKVVGKDFIYMTSTVEVKPTYPGGLTKFYEYFNSNFKISEENKAITKMIFFSFTVDTDGSLIDIKLLRRTNDAVDNEAIRVMKESPKWIPGEHNGKKVKVLYTIPIKITPQ